MPVSAQPLPLPTLSPASTPGPLELGGSPQQLLDRPWTLPARGAELLVRPARVADLPALAALLVRCSPAARLGWSGRGGGVLPLVQQEAWLREPGGVVVELGPHRLVAVAALRPATCTGVEDPVVGAAEVLVHDAWQRRGVGGALVRHLAAVLQLQGRSELQAAPDADRVAAQALLSGLGGRVRPQSHPHGRCPRTHVPRAAIAGLGQLREHSAR